MSDPDYHLSWDEVLRIDGEDGIGNYPASREALHAAVARVERAEALIRYAVEVEDGPCSFDHHGYCQAHPHSGADPEEGVPCWFVRARALLAPEGER